MKSISRILTALLAAAALTFAAGCNKDSKQDMKDAGQNISEAADKTGDAISTSADQAGDAISKSADKVGDAAKNAYDDTKKKINDATDE